MDPNDSAAAAGSVQGERGCEVSKRILLVDDDRLVLQGIADVLRSRGYQVWATDSVEEVEQLAREVEPDAVVTDYRMPRMDGIALVDRLRAQLHPAHMVIYSATPHPHAGSAAQLHDLTWVPKVAGHGALLETLQNLLEGEVEAR